MRQAPSPFHRFRLIVPKYVQHTSSSDACKLRGKRSIFAWARIAIQASPVSNDGTHGNMSQKISSVDSKVSIC